MKAGRSHAGSADGHLDYDDREALQPPHAPAQEGFAGRDAVMNGRVTRLIADGVQTVWIALQCGLSYCP